MKLAWLSDIHLDFINEDKARRFCQKIKQRADGVLISGDIAEGPILHSWLTFLQEELALPIWFVLGNHDLYDSSQTRVHAALRDLCAASPQLYWLDQEGLIRLTDSVGLVGASGWADGDYGDFMASRVRMNDFVYIEDLRDLTRDQELHIMRRWAEEAATHIMDSVVATNLDGLQHLLVLTHVPPFPEACLYRGQPSGPDILPFYCSKAMGEMLLRLARNHPELAIDVRCGHTHGRARVQPVPNLTVWVAEAEYGSPAIQQPVIAL